MAAGRGSRMKGWNGSKALLPLIPETSLFQGRMPILHHILSRLPAGPKAVIVHHDEEAVRASLNEMDISFCRQEELNGTGGAILAAKAFLADTDCDAILITMGDVPFVRRETCERLAASLEENDVTVLGFQPEDRKKYGILEINGRQVERITEWKYWREYSRERMAGLRVCNSGIYAVRRSSLVLYLPVLESRPQVVRKEVDGKMIDIQEFFITDLVEFMSRDGLRIGFELAADERETMGVDDPASLERAQAYYRIYGRQRISNLGI